MPPTNVPKEVIVAWSALLSARNAPQRTRASGSISRSTKGFIPAPTQRARCKGPGHGRARAHRRAHSARAGAIATPALFRPLKQTKFNYLKASPAKLWHFFLNAAPEQQVGWLGFLITLVVFIYFKLLPRAAR
jgi:hypothetical protein